MTQTELLLLTREIQNVQADITEKMMMYLSGINRFHQRLIDIADRLEKEQADD